mgnify:FL=1
MITFEEIVRNEEVQELVLAVEQQLKVLGYTEHSIRHMNLVAKRAGMILEELEYPSERIELARIAGYLHDIGNAVNRVDHAHTGAILAFEILKDMGMETKQRTEIMMAIGNHDENTGTAVSDISAALILADKSDVHRDRVVNKNLSNFDIHDRVNYAVTNAELKIDKNERKIALALDIDTQICPVLDYFEIFLERTMMSKYAAEQLKSTFELMINDVKLL